MYSSTLENFNCGSDPLLDFQDDTINLMFKPGHYELVENIHESKSYDLIYQEAVNFVKSTESEELTRDQNVEQVKTPCCEMYMQTAQFIQDIIDTNKDKEDILCPLCGSLIEIKKFEGLISKEQYERLKKEFQKDSSCRLL